MTRRQRVNPEKPDLQVIQEVASCIKEGKLVVLPTDTAYGLTGNPLDEGVVKRILTVKQRDAKSGMPLLAADLVQVQALAILPPLAEAFTSQFWPGAVTIITTARQEFPIGVMGPNNSLAVRIPNHRITLEVIHATGYPIIGTSANKSNTASPRTAEAAATQIGDQVDYILDAGPTFHTADSTIVNFTVDPPNLLREGAVPKTDIENWLKTIRKKC